MPSTFNFFIFSLSRSEQLIDTIDREVYLKYINCVVVVAWQQLIRWQIGGRLLLLLLLLKIHFNTEKRKDIRYKGRNLVDQLQLARRPAKQQDKIRILFSSLPPFPVGSHAAEAVHQQQQHQQQQQQQQRSKDHHTNVIYILIRYQFL